MGIFNQQPNYNQLFTKGKQGITGPQGPPGPPGPGFNLTSDGSYNIANIKLTSVAKGTASSDAVTKQQLDTKLSLSAGLMTGNLDMNNKRIYNVAQPDGDNQPATKIWSENKFLDKSSGLMAGSLNMSNNKTIHLATATANGDAVDFEFFNKYIPPGSRISSMFQCSNIALTGIIQSGYEFSSEAATIGWSNRKFLQRAGTNSLTSDLNMSNNKITHLATATQDRDATNKKYIDNNHLKLPGGHITGIVYKDTQPTTYNNSLLNYEEMKIWLVEKGNLQVSAKLYMDNNKIINLADPQSDKDDINKQYLEKSHIKPSHYNNEFKYLMANKLQWTDLLGDSFDITKIGSLMPHEANYHQYNHKVLFTTIRKNQKGGYAYKMGINCFPLDKDKDYTLCIKILNTDYQL